MYKKNNRVGSVKPKEETTSTKAALTITIPFGLGERLSFETFIRENCMTKGQFVRQCILAGMAKEVR